MSAYLITWNPDTTWKWTNLQEEVEQVKRKKSVAFNWSTGKNKSVTKGDRLYILKQGKGDRGIFGVGGAMGDVYEAPHYMEERAAAGHKALYVKGQWEALLNPYTEKFLDIEVLMARVPEVYWKPMASGWPLSETSAEKIETLWQEQLRQSRPK